MKLAIVGTGYVGLVTGVCFAEVGHEVVCVDLDRDKVERINAGDPPIFEAGLPELLERNVAAGRLKATTDVSEAVAGAAVSMIAVETPFDGKNIDLRSVGRAATDVGNALRSESGYHVVCVKSTVVPGTTSGMVAPLIEKASGKRLGVDLGIAMNPEFMAEGTAIDDCMNPDRVVIGADTARAAAVIAGLYEPFTGIDVVVTNTATAETIKYAANSFLATVISFANEIGNLCAAVGGVDVVDVMEGVHLDRRLSPILPAGRIRPGLLSFLFPGTGFGGSCFPKDVKALVSFGEQLGQPMRILKAVVETNSLQPAVTVDLCRSALGSVRGKRVAVLGLAFKPGTADVRESPAVPIIRALVQEGASVVAHDPLAIDNMKPVVADIPVEFDSDLQEVIRGADAIVLVTAWPAYRNIDEMIPARSTPVIDGRRLLDRRRFEQYRGIGLGQLDGHAN